jgi:hypothetical protein
MPTTAARNSGLAASLHPGQFNCDYAAAPAHAAGLEPGGLDRERME